MQNLTAAAIQLRFSWREKNLEQVRDYIFARLVRARASGANLAVLPAFTGVLPLRVIAGHGWSFERGMWELVARYGQGLEEAIVDWGKEMARHLGIYVCLGSVLVPHDSGVQNVAHLFSPEGKLVLRQAQTHTSEWERSWDLVGSSSLDTASTIYGGVGLVLNTDAWFPEVSRILKLQGADILLAPLAVRAPYRRWHQVRGMWQQVQQNQVFGVEAALVGTAGHEQFAGRSTLLGPVELSCDSSGCFGQVDTPSAEGVAVSTFDVTRLRRLAQDQYPLMRELNPDLYDRQLLNAYDRAAARGDAP